MMNRINEPAREGFLYHLWQQRSFHGPLSTVDGRRIEILERGEQNHDAGPDFLRALIIIDGEMKRGDVEIHPLAGDWFAHGHHKDPRYNNVILHVVTMHCPADFRTLRQDGETIPTLNLDQFLEKSAEELEADPESHLTAAAPRFCALSQQEEATQQRILERAGDERLRLKARRFSERRQQDSWDQIFYLALLESLGYSKNQIPFRNLASRLPVEELWSYLWNDPPNLALAKAEAYLFGVAGLLPSRAALSSPSYDADMRSYVRDLIEHWEQFPLRERISQLKAEAWQFFRLRPQNFPTRRLAAAAVLVMRFMDDGFAGLFEKAASAAKLQPRQVAGEFVKILLVEAEGFWADHYAFEPTRLEFKREAKNRTIVGPDRARDMVVNVVLPGMLAYSEEVDDGRMANLMLEVYARFPRLTENEITRFMRKQLFGHEKEGDSVVTGVRPQQGMIHLNKQLCRGEHCEACIADAHFYDT